MNTQFQVGKEYTTRLITDYDAKISFKVLKRTDKTVTVVGSLIDNPKTFKVNTRYSNFEQIRPWGSYSMCPVLGADDEVTL
jgi:hypothetical protein